MKRVFTALFIFVPLLSYSQELPEIPPGMPSAGPELFCSTPSGEFPFSGDGSQPIGVGCTVQLDNGDIVQGIIREGQTH
jgi:hypothetical protein